MTPSVINKVASRYMDPSIPLYKQLSTKLGIILILFSLVIFLLLYLLFAREIDVDRFTKEIQPELVAFSELNRSAWRASREFNALYNSDSAKDIVENHRKIQSNLVQIKNLSPIGKRQIAQMDSQMEQLYLAVNGLAENHERNSTLKRSVVLQLQLASNELHLALQQKQPEADKLYQQISADSVSDRVTVSRAKAHQNLSQELVKLKTSYDAVVNVLILFERLHLKYLIEDFDYHNQALKAALSQWQTQWQSDDELPESDKKLYAVLKTLNALMFEEQNAVAKWRGHIRVAQDYFASMAIVQSEIEQLIEKMKAADINLQHLPGVLNQIPYSNGEKPKQVYYLATIALVATFSLLACLLIYRVYLSIKRHSMELKGITEDALNNVAIDERKLWSKELTRLASDIANIARPEHGEAEYQALATKSEEFTHNLFELGHVAAFTTNKVDAFEGDFALELIFTGCDEIGDKWQRAFDKSQQRIIWQCVKKALASHKPETCLVENKWQQQLQCIVHVKEQQLEGVVIDQALMAEQIKSKRAELETLTADLDTIEGSRFALLNELIGLITRSMLQSQNPNKSYEDICYQTYRHQAKLLEWSEQALTVASSQKLLDSYVEEFDLYALLQASAYNALAPQKAQRNRVVLDIEPEVVRQVVLAQPNFSQCISGLIKLVLSEQLAATLIVNAKLVDKNPGQQVILFCFQVEQKSNVGAIPDIVTMLVEQQQTDKLILVQALERVITEVHGSALSLIENDTGYELSVKLPVALAERTSNENELDIDFEHKLFFVAGKKGSIVDYHTQAIEQFNGQVECFSSADHLVKSMLVKPLQQHPVAALVVMPDIFKTDQDRILQQISALPSQLRPKLYIKQSLFGRHIARQGVYNAADSCFFAHEFVSQLQTLLTVESDSNLLLAHQAFDKLHYRQSNTQVLLAVSQLTEYTGIIAQLHWLGLQVQVEVDKKLAQLQWQSGRYQILMTALELSPYVELNAGKPLARGVFSLSNELTLPAAPKSFEHWHQGAISDKNNLKGLINHVAPWLNELPPLELLAASKEAPKSLEISNNVSREEQIAELELDPIDSSADFEGVIDLAGYASNQGSPELAVFMLDEYLCEIDKQIDVLTQALSQNDQTVIHQSLRNLNMVGQILVARDFVKAVAQLAQHIENEVENRVEASLKAVATQQQMLHEFSLAI